MILRHLKANNKSMFDRIVLLSTKSTQVHNTFLFTALAIPSLLTESSPSSDNC